MGGTLSISIVETHASPLGDGGSSGGRGGPARSAKARVLAELQVKAKFPGKRASDEVEGLKFEVKWETSKGAFGVKVAEEDVRFEEGSLDVVSLFNFFLDVLIVVYLLVRTRAPWISRHC